MTLFRSVPGRAPPWGARAGHVRSLRGRGVGGERYPAAMGRPASGRGPSARSALTTPQPTNSDLDADRAKVVDDAVVHVRLPLGLEVDLVGLAGLNALL